MTAFDVASRVEAEAMLDLLPYAQSLSVQLIETKGQLFVQKHYGDFIARSKRGGVKLVEVKAERENIHGNLFIEHWSNRSRSTLGWMHTSEADQLWYYFVKSRELYFVEFDVLRNWGIKDGNLFDCQSKRQNKYDQLNDTWGWCVPITRLKSELGEKFGGPLDPVKETEAN